MRRGLMGWNAEELPLAAIETRLARLRTEMDGAGIDAFVVYTNNVRPSEDQSTQDCGEGGVLPSEAENAPEEDGESGGGVLPQEEEDSGTQPERQQAAAVETSELPFTGFAAIPVLLGGLALLTGGLVLRRRTR